MEKHISLKEVVLKGVSIIFLFLGITFALFFVHADDGYYCHTINEGDTVHKSFGSPVNFFSTNNETLLKIRCGEEKTVVEVGSGGKEQYIYTVGYRKNGSFWEKVNFTGENTVGVWIIGEAKAEVPNIKRGETGKVLAYICQNIHGVWKCGCADAQCMVPKWQMQEFDLDSRTGETEPVSNDFMQGQSEEGVLDVHYPSSNHALVGEEVTLMGSGFNKSGSNDILWNGKVAQTNLASKDGGTLLITVPALPAGKYEVMVRQGKNISEYGAVVWIGTGNEKTPNITKITPHSVEQGGVITIHGEGFTSTNNDAVTTYGVFENLPSKDGKTITFSYDPFDFVYNTFNEQAEDIVSTETIYVTVVNTSGISNAGTFILES